MKRGTKLAAVVGGGALAVGAFAVPALAGNGPGPAGRPGYQQQVQGAGSGDRLQIRARDGSRHLNFVAAGRMTQEQRTELAAMAVDEKLNHDLYAEFAEAYGLPFEHLATAEANHLQALRTLMERYGITDPAAGKAAGVFGSASVQATYDRLLAQGRASEQAALKVAKSLEQQAIARYGDAISGLEAPAAERVYTNLQKAETRHLAAISNWLAR